MRRFSLSVVKVHVKVRVKIPDNNCILWENGVPMRRGNPFPVWDSLPDPLIPQTPRTAAVPHPWSERRLKRAADISYRRYVTLIEINELSSELMTADQLLWHEERAAMRIKNTLVASREWHRKLTADQLAAQMPKYKSLVEVYEAHLHNQKTLTVAFRMLRKWVTRWRAAKLLYPKHHHHNLLDMLHIHHEDRGLASLVRNSTMHSLALSGIHRYDIDHSQSRTNSDVSRLTQASLD